MTPNRLGPILLGSPLLNVWHCRQTLATCSPCLGSAFAMYCAIGSGAAAAPGAEAAAAVAPASAPGGTQTGCSRSFGWTSWLARMPETIATIIAVSTDAMILFHSIDDTGVLCSSP